MDMHQPEVCNFYFCVLHCLIPHSCYTAQRISEHLQTYRYFHMWDLEVLEPLSHAYLHAFSSIFKYSKHQSLDE